MRVQFRILRPCLGLICLAAASAVEAQVSPPASTLGPPPALFGNIQNQSYLYPNNFSGGSATQGDTTIGAYYAGGEGQVALGKSTGPACCEGLVYADMHMVSAFEVLGPAGTTVSLILSANGTTSESNSAYAQASIDVEDPLGGALPNVGANACSWTYYQCAYPTAPASFTVSQDFTVTTNKVYWIRMSVDAYGDSGASGTVLYNALVDPNVAIDPSFNATGFSMIYSSDVAPIPTPLPACAWLLLAGLGGLGVISRRRRANWPGPMPHEGRLVLPHPVAWI